MSTLGGKLLKDAEDRQNHCPSPRPSRTLTGRKEKDFIGGEVVAMTPPPAASSSSSTSSPMDNEVMINRKRFEDDDGDQDMNLENVQEPKTTWADMDDSDEEDLHWSAAQTPTQLSIAEPTCEEPTNMEEYTYEDDGIEIFLTTQLADSLTMRRRRRHTKTSSTSWTH